MGTYRHRQLFSIFYRFLVSLLNFKFQTFFFHIFAQKVNYSKNKHFWHHIVSYPTDVSYLHKHIRKKGYEILSLSFFSFLCHREASVHGKKIWYRHHHVRYDLFPENFFDDVEFLCVINHDNWTDWRTFGRLFFCGCSNRAVSINYQIVFFSVARRSEDVEIDEFYWFKKYLIMLVQPVSLKLFEQCGFMWNYFWFDFHILFRCLSNNLMT